MSELIKIMLDRIKICINGQCYKCPYKQTLCTDLLIDDCYDLLKQLYLQQTGEKYDDSEL